MQEISSSPGGLIPQELIQQYQKLFECLENEWQALITSQEDAILTLAAEKEHILEKIAGGYPGLTLETPGGRRPIPQPAPHWGGAGNCPGFFKVLAIRPSGDLSGGW